VLGVVWEGCRAAKCVELPGGGEGGGGGGGGSSKSME